MKKIIVAISLICFIGTASAQEDGLIIQGTSPNLYIVHKTAAKENYYSVGRMYNVSPKEIATYNNLVFENGLNLGQLIKIPLTQNNFIQTQDAANNLVPVYHLVEPKEGLYRLSVNYNKVPMEQLKKWNNLSSDAVSNGTKVIVGYLKNQQESSETKTSSVSKEIASNNQEVAPAKEQAVVKKNTDISKETVPEIKSNDDLETTNNEVKVPAVKEQTEPQNIAVPASRTAINFNGGAFKKLYNDQSLNKTSFNESGPSGVFKSTSGWRDGKYYCFNNDAPVGTILKITNTTNGKSIYAKVLDLIPDIAQNTGLVLHVSNAAAEELGVSENRFDCSISYSK